MKTPPIRARRGFTLVELLVVIAIISVLAAAGFAAGNMALNRAKKVSAKAAAVALQQAVNEFYNTYGSLPDVGNSGGNIDSQIDTDDADGVELLEILLAKENDRGGSGGNVQNTRGMKFLDVKDGKGKRGGLIYGADKRTVAGLYDDWGNPYTVVMNTDYSDELEFSVGDERYVLNNKNVAVYTPGSDRKRGTKEDVTSW